MPWRLDDPHALTTRPLIPAACLREEIPIGERAAALIAETRQTIRDIISGTDPRLLVLVGPCSIHDPAATLEYAEKLYRVATRWADELVIVMRAYFEKPRTVTGWKGLISDPDLDGSCRINEGLRLARRLLLDINDLGVPTGSEFLSPYIYHYVGDLTSWVAIGARTAESQVHREIASGLPIPVGFKNGTDGNTTVAIDAVAAAKAGHWCPAVNENGVLTLVQTSGNDACHVVLRGGTRSGPNYDAAHVARVSAQLADRRLPSGIMVDCSHDNSGKDYRRQSDVAAAVRAQIDAGSREILGVMLESQLVEGRQDPAAGHQLVHGQSITDSCISFEQTERLLEQFGAANRRGRAQIAVSRPATPGLAACLDASSLRSAGSPGSAGCRTN